MMNAPKQTKITHEEAVKQLQKSMQSHHVVSELDTNNVASIPIIQPTPMSELPISQPIPPELESIDIEEEEEGYYVDEKELQLAKRREKNWL